MSKNCYFCKIKTIKKQKCSKCSVNACDKHRWSYVDESNSAITRNSQELCLICYSKTHPNDNPSYQSKLWQEYKKSKQNYV